jgi:hypothetical protein
MKNYKLLNSELNLFDTYDLNLSKYDNLKYLVFRTGITQWQLNDKNDMMDFTQILNLENYPSPDSIRFSVFIAWALCQKKLGININQINYIQDTTLNINKLYNYFIYLINDTTGLLADMVKWIFNFKWDEYKTASKGCDELNLLNTYDVKTIFNSSNQIYKVYYDYVRNSDIKISDVIDDKYIFQNKTQSIETSIYDDLEEIDELNLEVNQDDELVNNNINTIKRINDQKGGVDNKHIGIYKLKNGLGKVISIVPIAKIANIIQFCK